MLRHISPLTICFALTLLLVTSTGFAQDTAQSEAENGLLEKLTVQEILTAIKAPVIETFSAEVTGFESGDLVIVSRNGTAVTIRLYGIDCPEEGQAFYQEAKAFGEASFLGSQVEANIVATDNHELPVAILVNSEKQSLGHALAFEGLAWWDERNAPKDSLLRRLNADAVIHERGIFSDTTPLAPWDYRKSQEIEDFSYTLEEVKEQKETPSPSRSKAASEAVSLQKKGTMVESAPRSAPVKLDKPNEKVDAGALMLRHQPRIVKDSAGKAQGLTATDISAIPYAAQLGFKNGDVVSRVNGIAIESEAQIMSLIPQFQNVKQFQVEVIRNGQAMTIPITVP